MLDSPLVSPLISHGLGRLWLPQEERAFKRLPSTVCNRYFAKVYWRTKYCLLQKFGSECSVPPSRLARLKQVAGKYGLTDVRPGNIRCVGGVGKIVDATVVPKKDRDG